MNTKWMLRARALAEQQRATAAHPTQRLDLKAKDAATTEATLYVYEQIGIDWWTGTGCTAQDVIAAIAEAKKAGAKSLAVRILSEGGDAFEGLAIHEALKRCGLKTTAYNDGLCASAATMVALGCEQVIAAPTSTWMMHRASTLAAGHDTDLRAMADLLTKLDGTLASVYADKCGKTGAECQAMMAEEKGGPDGHWMNAEECKAAGFVDEIASAGPDTEDTEDDATASAVMRLVAQTDRRIAAAASARDRLATRTAKTNSSTPASRGERSGQPGARSTK